MFREVNVLVVEDDPAIREMMRHMSAAMTFRTRAVSTLGEGLDLLDWADIVVLDLKLPNGMGTTLLSRWTDKHKGPVIVVSGMIDRGMEERLLAARAWNVLQKPFGPDTLRSILQRYGEYVLECQRYTHIQEQMEKLEKDVTRLRRLAWSLAIIAAAAGAGAQPLLSLLTGG